MSVKSEGARPERLSPHITPEKATTECLTPTHERVTRTPSFRSHKRMSRRSKSPSINSLQNEDNLCLVEEPEFDINDTVVINVGGIRHEVQRRTLQRHPDTRLAQVVEMKLHYRPHAKEYYFDRDPYVFSAVLNYYRYGELHLPTFICNVVVAKELKYWGIEEDKIEACCWLEYNAAWDQMHMLSQFEEKQAIHVPVPESEKPSCFQRSRPRMWLMLEDPYSSKSAQILAWVSLAFVVVSIFSFCAETHPFFQSELTDEEAAEYASTYDYILGNLADSTGKYLFKGATNESVLETNEKQLRKARELPKDDAFYQRDPRDHTEDDPLHSESLQKQNKPVSRKYFLSAVDYVRVRVRRDESTTTVGEKTENATPTMTTIDGTKKRLTKAHPMLFFVDIICYCFFTIEIIVRFVFCPSKLEFFKDMFNLVDLLAILPFYVELVVNSLYREEQYKKSIVDVLLFTRILRIFRIFRLIRRHRGLQILVYTIRASMKEILLLLLFVIIGTILFSSLAYYAESGVDGDQSVKFDSIPQSFWWAVITMTTVGFGDMYPTTPWGYAIGACCSVSGVLLIAFTVPVIVNNFLLIYRYVQFQRDRPDPAEVEFRQKWEKKMMRSAESTLRLATIHVHVDNQAENNAISADSL